jgi:hypothetical protein
MTPNPSLKLTRYGRQLSSNVSPSAEITQSVTNAMTISAVVLLFGLIVLLLATYLIGIGKSSESVLRVFGTVLIIVIAVFLVVAGYTSDQIAPVMGLLGTVAGYLLAKDSMPRVAAESKHEELGGKTVKCRSSRTLSDGFRAVHSLRPTSASGRNRPPDSMPSQCVTMLLYRVFR